MTDTSNTTRLPPMQDGQVAAFAAELATGIILDRNLQRAINAPETHVTLFESLNDATEHCSRLVEAEPSIEYWVLDHSGRSLCRIWGELELHDRRGRTVRSTWFNRLTSTRSVTVRVHDTAK